MGENFMLLERAPISDVLLGAIYRLFAFFCCICFRFVNWFRSSVELPSFDDQFLLESATGLAFKIRTQQVRSEDVVAAFIRRIKQVNPIINCVVQERYKDALKEARTVDRFIKSCGKDAATLELETPFLGVPFTVKDSFSVKGLRFSAGSMKRDLVTSADSDVVTLMKNAGAIILAVTNIPELCMWLESVNTVYGRSRNPYDTRRTTAGSSGGEAGILSAGGSPCGIGSDFAGSIRLPSLFNGIFGHKPTFGIVSNGGHCPAVTGNSAQLLVSGPMSRYCCDLLPILRVLAANNVSKLKLETKVDVSKLRYFYMDNLGGHPVLGTVHPDIKQAQLKVLNYIRKTFGIEVKKICSRNLYQAFHLAIVKIISDDERPPCTQQLGMPKGEISLLREFPKWIVGRSQHAFGPLYCAFTEKLMKLVYGRKMEKYLLACDTLQLELQELLGDDGVLLLPSYPEPAPYHNKMIFTFLGSAYCSIVNALGVPATQVPLGIGSCGVPVGIQVVGGLRNDHLTLAVAVELEKAFGGWIPPSPLSC